jgi:hypothetical protein
VADFPSYESLGGDATGTRIGEFLFADYAEAGQSPNPGMGVWFFRTAYDAATGIPIDAAIAKHRREWRLALGLQPASSPIAPIAPREYSGNLAGVRVPRLPHVQGGAADASLVLSWFYDRYSSPDRAAIRSAWATRGQFDVLLSWPDSRSIGHSPSSFVATCRELIADGFRPCVMLLSKDFDPHHDVPGCLQNVEAVLPLLLAPRVASRICIGWELSLWLSAAEVQQLTDAIAPRCAAVSVKTYVHFQGGFAHYAVDGPNATFASYWNLQVGKLTGLLHQRDLGWTEAEYQSRLSDILVRFAGGFNTSPDSGFGHPFDCVAFEITAALQFNGTMSEAEGNRWGRVALATPTSVGPAGTVRVMGSGNGS